jgi:hypothetical protein
MPRFVQVMFEAPSSLRSSLRRILLTLPSAGQALVFDGTDFGFTTISSVALSNSNPVALGSAAPGAGATASRYDHVHPMPSASDVGADSAGTAAAAIVAHLAAATHAALATSAPSDLAASAAIGTSTKAAKEDHVHKRPTLTELGAEASANKGANNGYCGLDSGGLVDPSDLPTATTSAQGAVEFSTWAETQSTTAKVDAANALWILYDRRRPLWGRFSHLVFKNAVIGEGVWDAPTVTGTFTPTSQVSGTYGGWRRVTSTTTARGWYAGNTSSLLTWDLAKYVRFRFWLGTSDTTSNQKSFGALATVTTGPAEVIAVESAVTRCVRFGIDGAAFKAYNADGAARTVTNFTATPSNNVMYCFEVVMKRDGTIVFNIYSWTLDDGLVLVESQPSTTNVPTGATALWLGYWCAAASGSPTTMFGDFECVLNLE